MPAALGRSLRTGLRAAGALGLVAGRTALQLPRLDRRELMRALSQFGAESLSLALLVAALTGATVVLQTALYVQRFGARAYLGWAAGYAVLWEFGPLILGLLMAARVGARNAAELATLTVGGQIEGLRGISLDPFALLVAPRVLATALSVTCLSVVAFLFAILMEAAAAAATLHLPTGVFLSSFAEMLSFSDVVGGSAKALAFGIAIALVSTAAGLSAQGGARGVGRAAARAVVWSAAAIFLLDFGLTPLLVWLLS
ncbi:MAG: ABC transporter permease [Myxococcales bacterium]|nr:ABC transporter permease [Myxococcales bacterium]